MVCVCVMFILRIYTVLGYFKEIVHSKMKIFHHIIKKGLEQDKGTQTTDFFMFR